MTEFTVEWSPDAEEQLAEIWLNAGDDRQNVTVAQSQIDKELSNNPISKGRDLSEGLRLISVPPLKAFFEIFMHNRLVRVTAVGKTK
ncbi:MAG TPA: type II toxin-antitoxin system RelE/ParE family toxin [Gemmataceae bacterium]|nr:type II toxin-antitoxin system RelE/ParE family toxin [Gemmataceae bacterium]